MESTIREIYNKMTIYSPSQTTRWLECPIKRYLDKQGWESRLIGKRDLARWLGVALAEGIASHLIQQGKDPVAEGLSIFRKLKSSSHPLQLVADYDKSQYNKLEERIERGITKFINEFTIPDQWQIVGVEQRYPQYGNARPDLIVQDGGSGDIQVVDWKVKITLPHEFLNRELQRWRHSWQLFHYCWMLSKEFHQTISNYMIGLVILEPFSVTLTPFTIHPESMIMWEQSAQRVWAQMELEDTGVAQPWMVANHADQFGPCEFTIACLECHLDPTLLQHHYIKRGGSDGIP